jgi:V8-like Glu-specific endopeptidase
MYGMSARVNIGRNNSILTYEIDTSEGKSGSSIYYYSTRENKYFSIGVHARGYVTLGYNEGTFLTPERIGKIQEWMESKFLHT